MLKKSSKFKQAFELNLYLQSQINFKKQNNIILYIYARKLIVEWILNIFVKTTF